MAKKETQPKAAKEEKVSPPSKNKPSVVFSYYENNYEAGTHLLGIDLSDGTQIREVRPTCLSDNELQSEVESYLSKKK